VAARIVRMFQRYAQSIDPDDKRFTGFITQYLRDRNVKDPEALRYSELYNLIKEGIRAYFDRRESLSKAGK
jgi:hypothetical protein